MQHDDSAVHQALAKLLDERDFERRCNGILEAKLREIINVTYESGDPAIAVTRIRGMAGACLRTYRQERGLRKRTWRDRLATWWTTHRARRQKMGDMIG